MEFRLTKEHLRLMKKMNVGWSNAECGAPEIDPKRPYGNGDYIQDVMNALEWDTASICPHCGETINEEGDELIEQAIKIHKETETALQIVLQTQSFVPGIYELDNRYNWSLKSAD